MRNTKLAVNVCQFVTKFQQEYLHPHENLETIEWVPAFVPLCGAHVRTSRNDRPNFKPELGTHPRSLNISHKILKCSPVINFRFDLGFPSLLCHLCTNWNMASEYDHVHWSRESSDFEEDKTLLENASKQYGLQPTSLNHAQQKTNLLMIAVIRKRRRWTTNMAVARIVSSGKHFCLMFTTFSLCVCVFVCLFVCLFVVVFVCLLLFFVVCVCVCILHWGKNILGHFKRRFVPQILSQSLKQGHI